jgi:hypothetical protein
VPTSICVSGYESMPKYRFATFSGPEWRILAPVRSDFLFLLSLARFLGIHRGKLQPTLRLGQRQAALQAHTADGRFRSKET